MAYIESLDTNEEFEIPIGDTAIGRGPFLKVTEKKVSRNHALIRNDSRGIFISSLHKNPTFIYNTDDKVWVPLEKDECRKLIDGAKISLLPDSLRFIVNIRLEKEKEREELSKEIAYPKENLQKSTDNKQKRDQKNGSNKQKKVDHKKKSREALNLTSKPDEFDNTVTVSLPAKKSKKRQLPFWMTQNTSNSSPKKNTTPKKADQSKTIAKNEETKLSNSPVQDRKKKTAKENEDEHKENKEWRGQKRSRNTCGAISTHDREDYEENIVKVEEAAQSKCEVASRRHGEDANTEKSHATEGDLLDELIGVCSNKRHNDLLKQLAPADKQDTTADKHETPTDKHETPAGKHEAPTCKQDTLTNTGQDNQETSVLSQLMNNRETSKKQPVEDSDHEMIGDENIISPLKQVKSADNSQTKLSMLSKNTQHPTKLPFCPYGSKCYRKNPLHFTEYSHSTDDDDEAADNSKAGDDSKAECPYGTSCYRRNSEHRREYKHTKDVSAASSPVARRKRTSRNVNKVPGKIVLDDASDDDGEANTYDYDDSFLDDEDGDGSDEESFNINSDNTDSDYKPDDVADDEEDDVSELVNEAKDFITNKKMYK